MQFGACSHILQGGPDIRLVRRQRGCLFPFHALVAQDAPRPGKSNAYVTEKWRDVPLCRMSERGHERRFRAVRRMSAYLLTAAESQTFSNRRLGPEHEVA